MRLLTILTLLFQSLILTGQPNDFKSNQLRYQRAKKAYINKYEAIKTKLGENDIDIKQLELYIRAFKYEKELEIWGKNKTDSCFRLINTLKICRSSGTLGPKRREGDRQIPEGFYHIMAFNPVSRFHLSLCINYPNKSDKILSDRVKPGGNICIHGACVTIGCLPLTDDKIEELYIYAVEARNNGQDQIPVSIYPIRFTEDNFIELSASYNDNPSLISFWTNIKQGYDYFEKLHLLPRISFNKNGSYCFSC